METTIEIITPAIAADYLKHNTKNRNISERKVAAYALEMREGRWKLNGQTISFDVDGVLNDGQHRLRACIAANISFPCIVVRGTDADVMDTIDCGRARTAGDVLKIKGIAQANHKASAARKFLRLSDGYTAVGDARGHSGETGGITNARIWECYRRYHDIIDIAVLDACKYYDASRILMVSDMAGIITFLHITKGYEYGFVASFFAQLCDHTSTKYNVIRQLRRVLQDDKDRRVKMTAAVRQAYIIKTWNYYATKKDVKILKIDPKYDFGRSFI